MFFLFKEVDLLRSFDCFFLTYDEPNKEERWKQVKEKIPHAQWVDGVKGFDKAHKTCARLATTKRLTIIDGDNAFLDKKPVLRVEKSLSKSNYVLSYSSQNNVNGLSYGNGGLKSWPRDVLLNCFTHEEADDEEGAVDFCFKVPYYQVSQRPTETIINQTPYQAFRAGYREGIKMSLHNGKVVPFESHNNLKLTIPKTNFFRLKVWLEIGRDVTNGDWAIFGARKGLYDLMTRPEAFAYIKDYDWFNDLWGNVQKEVKTSPCEHSIELAKEIQTFLGESIKEYDKKASLDYKLNIKNPKREGLMIPSLGEKNA